MSASLADAPSPGSVTAYNLYQDCANGAGNILSGAMTRMAQNARVESNFSHSHSPVDNRVHSVYDAVQACHVLVSRRCPPFDKKISRSENAFSSFPSSDERDATFHFWERRTD